MAYAAAVLILAAAALTPYFFFQRGMVFAATMSVGPAALGCACAAGYYHLVVRRNLRRSEADRHRYQQAMHFVTHEMRTPLSAIQGSSELISRYALTEEKRKQIAQTDQLRIEAPGRAWWRVFLNVERLSAGQMELKHEAIPVKQMVEHLRGARAAPGGAQTASASSLEPCAEELQVTGDRELMEYACYNLLTNAVKYSPQQTEVTVIGLRKTTADIRICGEGPGDRHGPEGSQADLSEVLSHQKGGRIGRSGHRNRPVHRPTDRGAARRGRSR